MTSEDESIHGHAVLVVAEERPGAGELLRHAPFLLAAARAIVMNEAEAEDLVQITFELALRHRDQLHDPGALRAWLLTIETREAFRLVRRLRRFVHVDPEVVEIPQDTGADVTDAIALHRALAALPRRTRAAVVLHHMAGLSVRETSVALGVSENTVKAQLKTGLVRLRQELGHD